MKQGSIPFAAMMPHAPVLIPSIGGNRHSLVAETFHACEVIARELVRYHPDMVVLFSPHTPVAQPGRMTYRAADCHQIDFTPFGGGDFSETLPNCDQRSLAEWFSGASYWAAFNEPVLDHGAGVPLYFLYMAGWRGRTLILSPNYWSKTASVVRAGEVAAQVLEQPLRIAVIASADMSHALQKGAPGGFHPDAYRFDVRFQEILDGGTYQRLNDIPDALQRVACEDALVTTLMALTATAYDHTNGRVLSYEAPFGVGYLAAIFHATPLEDG